MNTVPDCEGDERYISDAADLSHEDRLIMVAICDACPLYTLCADYARADKPRAGWWPGLNLTVLRKDSP